MAFVSVLWAAELQLEWFTAQEDKPCRTQSCCTASLTTMLLVVVPSTLRDLFGGVSFRRAHRGLCGKQQSSPFKPHGNKRQFLKRKLDLYSWCRFKGYHCCYFFKAQELLSHLLEKSEWKFMKQWNDTIFMSGPATLRGYSCTQHWGQPRTLQRKHHVTNRCFGLLAAMGHWWLGSCLKCLWTSPLKPQSHEQSSSTGLGDWGVTGGQKIHKPISTHHNYWNL